MRKLMLITWLAALAFTVNAFAQGSYQDIQTRNSGVTVQTNITVATVPILLDSSSGANVRVIYNSGTTAVNLLLTTASSATATVTNQLSGSLGVIALPSSNTIVFRRGGTYDLWTGPIYSQSAGAATNAVIVSGYKP